MSTTGRRPSGGSGGDRAPAELRAATRRARPLDFANWSVRSKLLAILVLPVLAAVAVGIFRVSDLLATADEFARDAERSEAQRAASLLVTEMAREQLVGSAGAARVATTALASAQAQNVETDASAERLLDLVGEIDEPGTQLQRATVRLENSLETLDDVRVGSYGGTGSRELTPAQVVRAYDGLMAVVLGVGDALVAGIEDDSLQALAVSSQSLTATKRQSAREDALVLAVAASPEGESAVDPAELRTAVTDRSAALTGFQTTASAAQQSAYSGAFNTEEGRQRTALFAEVLRTVSTGGRSDLAVPDWLAVALPAADSVDAQQQAISDEQVRTAQSLRDSTQGRALREGAVVAVLLLLGFLITFLAVRSVLRPLRRLRADALEVAERRLPENIAAVREGTRGAGDPVEPIGVGTTEEIGQVARAFDAVHAEALRLAGQQEQLRRNVNEIFVNLSRRSQGLVERQLALIDRLENEEQDPDQLSQLFRLDHLAARMRRNNDNLMVLAGSDAGRGAARPLAVVDVVRAAVSETEQYERIVVNPTPDVTVGAGAANDLIHLLAELLDNATVFSPPETPVTVAVSGTFQEGIVVEVYDRGLGMDDADLDALNRKLAEPPVVDAQVPRQMGLFVVGRLARRHEMQVELRASAGGTGTVASVWVPPAVLVSPAGSAPATTGGQGAAAPRPAAVVPPSTPRFTPAAPAAPVAPVAPRTDGGPVRETVPTAQRDGRNPLGSPNGGSNGGANGGSPTVPASADVPGPRPDTVLAPVPPAAPTPFTRVVPPPAPVPAGATAASAVEAPRPDGPLGTAPGSGDALGSGDAPRPDGSDAGADGSDDRLESTPIFAELSAWFRADALPAAPRPTAVPRLVPNGDGPVIDLTGPRPVLTGAAGPGANGSGGPDGGFSRRVPEAPAASLVPRPSFDTAADAGWAAAAAAEAGRSGAGAVTAAGLPRRRPMANLVPGSAAPVAAETTAPKLRDADSVRRGLSSYQRGLQSGRNRLRPAAVPDLPPDPQPSSAGDDPAPATRRDDERRTAR